MIKPEELRIGNLIVPNEDTSNVMEVTTYHFDYAHLFQGIPLTEEWLLKLGYRKYTSGVNADNEEELALYGNGSNIKIGYSNNEFSLYIDSIHLVFLRYIFNIHTLQNLYFALTGEELVNV